MLQIKSKVHDYSVFFENSIQDSLKNAIHGTRPFFLVDRNVYTLYKNSFAVIGSAPKLFLNAAIEENKSYEKIEPLFHWLLENEFQKDCTLIVVGGGITQDVGCFVSTVLFRGTKWKLIPTTLLAQGDSCIGSKSSINIGHFKNQLGSFYPPHSVHLSFDVLATLSEEAVFSGLGEIIKLSLLSSEEDFQKTTRLLQNIRKTPNTSSSFSTLVKDALLIKKTFIEADEFDQGVRNILNYGHTFGHAIESASHYKIPHGLAVTLGMMCATFFSEKLGFISSLHAEEVTQTLLPICKGSIPTLVDTNITAILLAMKHDKKNTAGKINCILTRGFGKMERMPLDLNKEIAPYLEEFINGLSALI